MTAETPTSKRLAFNGPMTIYDAGMLKAELSAALDQAAGTGLEIDVSRVTEIDLTGLQLLVLACRECSRLQSRLSIVGATAAVREAIDFCNLGSVFGEVLVSPAAPASRSSTSDVS